MKFILGIIYFFVLEHFLFNWQAKREAKKCNYDCTKCGNWACMHDRPEKYRDLIMRDYSNNCGKSNKFWFFYT